LSEGVKQSKPQAAVGKTQKRIRHGPEMSLP